jgi:hypothetical protein
MLKTPGLSLLLGNDTTPLRLATTMSHHSVWQRQCHAQVMTLGNDATPLGDNATLSKDATLSKNSATVGNDTAVGNDAALGNDAARGGITAKRCNNTLGDKV